MSHKAKRNPRTPATSQRVAASLLCDLTPNLQGRTLHALNIGAHRDVSLLSTARPLQARAGRSPGPKNFRVHHWHAGTWREFDLPPTPQIYFHAQPLGDNFLCVASRCASDEPNAHLFDDRGDALSSWHAGDGIEDVQIAPDGKIWISYFDEGVFSGSPLGAQGLNCFDETGARLFGFVGDIVNLPEYARGMADCYALNVASNRDVWLFYYTSFPLVHLRELKLKAVFEPAPEIIGSHAFAVCDSRRLFVGGYQRKGRIFWRDEARKLRVEIEVVDEAGEPVIWNRACGRGADLFLCDEARVYLISLNEVGF